MIIPDLPKITANLEAKNTYSTTQIKGRTKNKIRRVITE